MSDQLIELFARGLGVAAESLNEETSAASTAEWDSLAAMNMVTLLEDTFEIRLKTKDIMRMQTIGIARSVLRDKGVDGI